MNYCHDNKYNFCTDNNYFWPILCPLLGLKNGLFPLWI
nr:MAG TPA: hypothetical protein [Caudoviricetes sp.]